MRLLLTAIILTMLAQPAWAKTSGQLFEDCKPWANNGFSFDGLTEQQLTNALICSSFHSGVIHLGYFVCQEGHPETSGLFGTSITSTHILTQRFLNWAEANPELWEFTADPKNWIMGTCKE